jgi:peptide/nickel transport system ATP-binding protein
MDNPAHPYTKLLMESVPRVGDKWERDIAMSDIEEKEYAISYCKFAHRCPYATEECRKERPLMKDLADGRRVLCNHPLGV